MATVFDDHGLPLNRKVDPQAVIDHLLLIKA